MSGSGQRILDGLRDAVAGNFARVTIDGQTWVRQKNPLPTLTEEEIVKLMRSAGFDTKTIKELTYTSWKDGIDIERPTTMTMKFVALIRTGDVR